MSGYLEQVKHDLLTAAQEVSRPKEIRERAMSLLEKIAVQEQSIADGTFQFEGLLHQPTEFPFDADGIRELKQNWIALRIDEKWLEANPISDKVAVYQNPQLYGGAAAPALEAGEFED